MSKELLYVAIDVHAKSTVIGSMAMGGKYRGDHRMPTSESALISHLASLRPYRVWAVVEESTLSRWVSQVLHPYVERVVVCDPRQNALISRNTRKNDFNMGRGCSCNT